MHQQDFSTNFLTWSLVDVGFGCLPSLGDYAVTKTEYESHTFGRNIQNSRL